MRTVGAYVLLAELAQGGQGSVWRARHEPTGEEVALKLLTAGGESAALRFAQEARVLARLSHPNVVRVLEHGEDRGAHFLACELVAGEDLAARVRKDGLPPPAWIVHALSGVARALQHCHEQGVVHRDVKPGNILVERGSLRPVLVDFGLIKRDPAQMGITSIDDRGELSVTGSLKGTPEYMAPEQVHPRHGVVGPATDVYGLGGTLYFLLTGQAPFAGESLPALLRKVTRQPPIDPTSLVRAAPPGLARLALLALAKDPRQRPQTAEAFAQALAAAAPPPAPAPQPAPGTSWSWPSSGGSRGLLAGLRAPAHAGQRVGPFTVVRELGRGAMGVVFEARGDDGRPAALKLLSNVGSTQRGPAPAGASGERTRKRFEREVQALASLEHPNVVRFLGAGAEGTPWLAMELVAGRDLQHRLEKGGKPAWEETARLVSQIARGVAHAHERGVIHRDLKPSNVLVREPDGEAVVTDFGLARSLEASKFTRTGDTLGTLAYMAPEQVKGQREEGPPADVWALGGILFRCLTGEPPFASESPMGLAASIVQGQTRRPSSIDGRIPSDLERVCLACLQPDPARRPTAGDVARALASRQPLGDPPRRSLALLVGALGLTAVAVTAGAGALLARQAPAGAAAATTTGAPGPGAAAVVTAAAPPPATEAAPRAAGAAWGPYRDLVGDVLRVVEVRGRPRWLHRVDVRGVAVTRDGALAVSPDVNVLRVWDVSEGRTVARLAVPEAAQVLSVLVTPDGALAVAGTSKGTTHLFDLPGRRHLAALPMDEVPPDLPPLSEPGGGEPEGPEVFALAMSPDGRRVLAGECWGRVRELDLAERAVVARWRTPLLVRAVALAQDGHSATGCQTGALVVRDPGGARRAWTRAEQARPGELPDGVWSLAFSPDGRELAVGRQKARVQLWDVHTRTKTRELQGHQGGVWGLAYLEPGRLLSGSTDHTMALWDLASGRRVRTYEGHRGWVLGLTAAGGRAFTAGRDRTLRRWDVGRGEEVTGNLHDGVVALGALPDGTLVTAGREGRAALLAPDGGVTSVAAVATAAVAASGTLAATIGPDGALAVWDLAPGRAPQRRADMQAAGASRVAVAPTGGWIVWTDREGTERRWVVGEAGATVQAQLDGALSLGATDGGGLVAATGRGLVFRSGPGVVTGAEAPGAIVVATAGSGPLVVAGHADGAVSVWNLDEPSAPRGWVGPPLRTPVSAVACSHDGRLAAAGGRGGEVVLLELASGRALDRVDLGPLEDAPTSLCFDAAGRLLVGTELGVVLVFEVRP